MSRGMRGLGPPEYVAFAQRRRDLNELLWPAIVSFRDYMERWIEGGKPPIDTSAKAGNDEALRFDVRRVLSQEGYHRFESALCRSVAIAITAEFESFIDAFWTRVQEHPHFKRVPKLHLFDVRKARPILHELRRPGTRRHIVQTIFARELQAEIFRFKPRYTVDLIGLQAYFRQIRNCLVHNGGTANERLETSSKNLQRLSIESRAYWRRHKFDVRYYSSGDRIELTPRTTIAMLHFLTEFVEMLASHLASGRLGATMFNERLDLAVEQAVEWIGFRHITSQRRLSDDAFLGRRVRQPLIYDGLRIPRTQDGASLISQLVADVRAKLR